MLPIFNEVLRDGIRREENLRYSRIRRTVRNLFDVNNIPANRFKELFRINKTILEELEEVINPHITSSRFVSKRQKILTALRFYATGCYQRSVGNDFNLAFSQTSAHRYIHEITNVIEGHLCPLLIKFPSTFQEIKRNKQEFMDEFNFPGVLGVIDGTHIAILKPQMEEHNFINRNGYHSINCQIICDAKLKIISLNSNYGGSTHDAFIWRNSRIRQHLLNLRATNHTIDRAWLIGDSGYPVEPILMIPYRNPQDGSPESRFNDNLCSARNCIERCVGLLKMRFRCLLKERVARYDPLFVSKLSKACSALHNMCINHNVEMEPEDFPDEEIEELPVPPHLVDQQLHNAGVNVRNSILNLYYV